MGSISDELKKAISEIQPSFVATADKEGKPNVSTKGSLSVLDENHLVFAELMSPQTIKNLKENPYLSIIALNPETRKGWRIWGKSVELMTSGDAFDKFTEKYAKMGKVNYAVKILVEKGIPF